MNIIAKFRCYTAKKPEDSGTEQVELYAVCEQEGPNAAWAKATPSGHVTMGIDNPGAQGVFKEGAEYLVTFQLTRDVSADTLSVTDAPAEAPR
jgi:hypothetical protein